MICHQGHKSISLSWKLKHREDINKNCESTKDMRKQSRIDNVKHTMLNTLTWGMSTIKYKYM